MRMLFTAALLLFGSVASAALPRSTVMCDTNMGYQDPTAKNNFPAECAILVTRQKPTKLKIVYTINGFTRSYTPSWSMEDEHIGFSVAEITRGLQRLKPAPNDPLSIRARLYYANGGVADVYSDQLTAEQFF